MEVTALKGSSGDVQHFADFHAWRDNPDWTMKKHAAWDPGERAATLGDAIVRLA